MSARRRTFAIAALGLLVVVAAFLGVFASRPFRSWCCAREWRRWREPGGTHAVVLYRVPEWFGLPGQASDAPGFVQLVDGGNRPQQTAAVDMVQDVSEPEWEPGLVRIKLIAAWPLR